MPLPPLPKLLALGGLRALPDLAARLHSWSRGVQQVLGALRASVEKELLRRDGTLAALGDLDLDGFGVFNAGRIEFLPSPFRFETGTVTLDVSLASCWTLAEPMSTNSSLTLANGSSGANGIIWVQQDATGSRTLTFDAPGWTILRELGAANSNPQAAANTVTQYRYFFVVLAGVQTLVIFKEKLT